MGVIGLTGGIASGKTLASDCLRQLGADIIDTDLITRELYAPGSGLLKKIEKAFGLEFILADGNLDRRRLREKVFPDAHELKKLNEIVHPAIKEATAARVFASPKQHQVIVVPLLIEAGYTALCDEIWVMYVDEAEQKKRLLKRDGVTPALAETMIKRQLPFDEKAKYAQRVIDNTGNPQKTKKQIKRAYRKFKKNNY
ncbi:MAG TPA: dephospho-CoA kinase [Clostridiales bacterium]|nr:dephospho-CoA kinase [Clostridiales bacterium]